MPERSAVAKRTLTRVRDNIHMNASSIHTVAEKAAQHYHHDYKSLGSDVKTHEARNKGHTSMSIYIHVYSQLRTEC
jgi:hypothetical protein